MRTKIYIKGYTLKVFYLSFIFFFAFPSVAFAYLDPGLGSMIFQGIAAGLLLLGVSWRYIKDRIKQFFSSDKNKDE